MAIPDNNTVNARIDEYRMASLLLVASAEECAEKKTDQTTLQLFQAAEKFVDALRALALVLSNDDAKMSEV